MIKTANKIARSIIFLLFSWLPISTGGVLGYFKKGGNRKEIHGDEEVDFFFYPAQPEITGSKYYQIKKRIIHKNRNNGLVQKLAGNALPQIRCLNFSGQGQQIQDLNGDKIGGLNGCLVGCGLPAKKVAGKYI